MKELVLEFIASYQGRISEVEELFSTTYEVAGGTSTTFADLDRQKDRLESKLRETLAKNCSLRRKDFDNLMATVLADFGRERSEIEEEEKQVKQRFKQYLNEQKQLAFSLRQQVVKFTQEQGDHESLTVVIREFKTAYEDRGRKVFTLIHNLRLRLETFRGEQEELNHKLERLIDRGESLSIEDLRQLEAAKARQERKTERELRRDDIERLLSHFKQQRQSHNRIATHRKS